MIEYANKEKLARAEAEAHVTGGDVMAIYVRLGGLLKENGQAITPNSVDAPAFAEKEEATEEKPKKAKKK